MFDRIDAVIDYRADLDVLDFSSENMQRSNSLLDPLMIRPGRDCADI